jgi:hypothetical protein
MKRYVMIFVAMAVSTAAFAVKADDQALERKVLADFGKCVVKLDPLSAKKAVLSDLDASEIYRDYKKLMDARCLPSTVGRGIRLQMDDLSLKAAIAQALINRDLTSQPSSDFSLVAPLSHRQPYPLKTVDDKTGQALSEKSVKSQQEAIARKALAVTVSRFGECVVRTDSAGARNVVLTAVGTPEEMAAIKGMAPALSNCIVKGENVAFTRLSIRNTLAVNYYRLANAVPGGSN